MTGEDQLNHAAFRTLVGQSFHVHGPEGLEAEFELIGVTELAEAIQLPEGFRDPFSLLFSAPEEVKWTQGTYTFVHEAIGEHALFCTAIVHPTRPGGHAYEVVFA